MARSTTSGRDVVDATPEVLPRALPVRGVGWLQLACAVLAGLAVGAGFEPIGWWPATIAGTAALVGLVRRVRRPAFATTLGYAFGLGLTSLTLNWMANIHPAVAVGLIAFMSCWYALLGLMLHLAGRSRWWPLLAAVSWVAVDFASARFPFGGFGWLRLGYPMLDSPLAGLLPLVGVAGLGSATALLAALLAWVISGRSRRRVLAAGALTVAIASASAVGWTQPPAASDGVATLGWVQGGAPGGGVYGLGPPRTITTNQAAATVALAQEVAAGRQPTPDFVVWPENSTDLDPDGDAVTSALVRDAVSAIGRPVLVGSILDGPGSGERRTASQWREPDGTVGPTYVKRSIVPFGEWIPFRDFLLPLVPILEYVGDQSVAGTEPGLLDVELADGRPVTLGVLVCFDVAFDPVVHDVAAADLLVVQSSNAMYQGTGQIEQQFAITRARAAELRREILVVTTSGVSGLIGPDGAALMRETGPEAAKGVVKIPLRTGVTTASWLAGPLELGLAVLAGAWLAALLVEPTRRRRAVPRTPSLP
ncbi:apolipoprotein N-acyltransferase [Tessaracoccus sp. OS52]|uniref:apolipoprotein N-acyltransferase n=1 Tax=Tessaracoccus sp. OS52 TaxID=2886691 RepID=UPI001D10032C|nr:apolipoprotein N-acyltransferase [Tessaracoccus sp. OS52]MCC2594091.1 apolipoprotein N-acyltransferase [Tessaracoccus sp. OS52]